MSIKKIKIAGIMQPYLFPYIGYWQLMNSVNDFILLDDANFIKKGWINRNYILYNGRKILFTLPLSNASQNIKISDHTIASYSFWSKKFIKTIELAYSQSPHFEDVMTHVVLPTLLTNETNLAKFLFNSILLVNKFLGISCKVYSSLDFPNEGNLAGQMRIIDLCRRIAATRYSNLPGGKLLYSKSDFQDHDVEINFIEPTLHVYSHIKLPIQEFYPALSILDVLFNCGQEKTRLHLKLEL